MKIGVVQFDIRLKQREQNLEKAQQLIEKAATKGAEIVCLPSNFLSDLSDHYSLKELRDYAEPLDGPSLTALVETASRLGIYLVAGTIFEALEAGVADTSTLISPDDGIIGVYRRTHLVEMGAIHESEKGVVPGSDYPVFDLLDTKIAIMVDIDLDFPEVARIYRIMGAEVLFYPSHCSSGFVDSHRFQTAARAYENQMYLVDVNRVGFSENSLYIGDSRILSPKADIVVSAGKHAEGVAVGEVDLSYVREYRDDCDLLADRNLDSYQTLLVS